MSALLFAELLGNRNIGSQNCCCAFLELCLDMSGKYDKNKSGAAHHNTIVLHNAQWPCQKCLGFSSFSFGTILSGAVLQTQTMAGVLIHVPAWRHRAPLCCCRVTQQHIVQETCSITSPPPHSVIRHESRTFVLVLYVTFTLV